MTGVQLHVFETKEQFFTAAIDLIFSGASAAPTTGTPSRRTSLALSGGSTPAALYKMLRDNPEHLRRLREQFDFYFGDVRFVPDNHPDSNFTMAKESLLCAIDSDHYFNFPVPAASDDESSFSATKAVEEYRDLLSSHLPLQEENVPVFDIVLLGFGPDGHTASIFPGTAAAKNYTDVVTTCMPPAGVTPLVERGTLTPKTIIEAQNVIVMATGANKRWVIEGLLAPNPEPAEGQQYPVCRFLRECKGKVHVLVDADAAPAVVEPKC